MGGQRRLNSDEQLAHASILLEESPWSTPAGKTCFARLADPPTLIAGRARSSTGAEDRGGGAVSGGWLGSSMRACL
eukprot:554570-Hanusia_phi.AAC.1